MNRSLSAIARTRLEKVAFDNGFDLERPSDGAWLRFESSHADLGVWLTEFADLLVAAFSHPGVVAALADHGTAISHPLPGGACGARAVPDFARLHELLRRAILLARTVPDALYQDFTRRTSDLPCATEAERLVVQRVGQDLFRQGLLDLWHGQCAITGLAVPALLRASHAKPWKDCATDAERLDVYNGLLLAAHLDAAFDAGLLAVEDDGQVRVSGALDQAARELLGLDRVRRVRGLAVAHRPYLAWHRQHVFHAEASR